MDMPRQIGAESFVVARAKEMRLLLHNAETNDSRARVFQSLPRHLRRRAMSHNIHRIPVRFRAAAHYESDKMPPQPPPSKRRQRRRAKYTLQSHEHRQERTVWLETHLWSAKRMRMFSMWGMRLPWRPNDKSVRACLRASHKTCTLQDASFLSCVSLKGARAEIVSILHCLLPPFQENTLEHKRFVAGANEGDLLLYHPDQYPSGVIAPVAFQWKPATTGREDVTQELWLWVHASVLDVVLPLLTPLDTSSVCVKSLRRELLRFELRGAECGRVLGQVLRTDGMDVHQPATPLVGVIESGSPSPGTVISFTASDPRAFDPHQPFRAQARSELHLERARERKRIKRAARRAVKRSASRVKVASPQVLFSAESPLWDEGGRKVAFESLYPPSIGGEKKRKQLPTSFVDTGCPVMLIRTPRGWDVVAPRGWGMPFWKALVYSGARVIGWSNRRAAKFEFLQPSFPEDFVDSCAGHMMTDWLAAQDRVEWSKKPKGKRVNFHRLAVDHPFQPAWEQLLCRERDEGMLLPTDSCSSDLTSPPGEPPLLPTSCPRDGPRHFFVLRDPALLHKLRNGEQTDNTEQAMEDALVRVRVSFPGKGSITQPRGHRGTFMPHMLCIPSPSDMSAIQDESWAANGAVEEPLRQTKGQKLSRLPVGWITYGDFCSGLGACAGVGFVTLRSLSVLQRQCRAGQGVFCLVRANASRVYQVVTLSVFVDG